MSSFPRLHKRRLKRHLLRNQTRRSTAIRVRVMPSLAITENTTTLPRLTLPTVGQANFYINNCGDFRSLQWAAKPENAESQLSHSERMVGKPYIIGLGKSSP